MVAAALLASAARSRRAAAAWLAGGAFLAASSTAYICVDRPSREIRGRAPMRAGAALREVSRPGPAGPLSRSAAASHVWRLGGWAGSREATDSRSPASAGPLASRSRASSPLQVAISSRRVLVQRVVAHAARAEAHGAPLHHGVVLLPLLAGAAQQHGNGVKARRRHLWLDTENAEPHFVGPHLAPPRGRRDGAVKREARL